MWRQILSIIGVILLANSTAIITVLVLANEYDQNPSLREVLIPENCMNPCWEGIEPSVTEHTAVKRWLEQTGTVEFDPNQPTEAEGVTYSVPINEDSRLMNDQYISLVMIRVEANQITSSVSLTNIDVCLFRVLDAFGIPQLVGEDDFQIRLGYPAIGLLFQVRKDTARINDIMIMNDDRVSNYTIMEPVHWDTIVDKARECQDNF